MKALLEKLKLNGNPTVVDWSARVADKTGGLFTAVMLITAVREVLVALPSLAVMLTVRGVRVGAVLVFA